MTLTRRSTLLGLSALLLSACVGGGGKFETDYTPVPADLAKSWRLAEVRVSVPKTLVVSEAKSLLPRADIVWREDPIGDRRPQVAKILTTAISQGAKGLKGPRAVRLVAVTREFHAMTFEAESLNLAGVGVHNVRFSLAVQDAKTGAVLYGPVEIDATFPAMTGPDMIAARLKGETQRSQIIAHVSATVSGWLGTGPDMRMGFVRIGR